ncbi:MAG: hypothetical protein B6I29_05200 [Marinitoga sp. 4572_148]|nr:MAG: hypothetical protein B6I29_05200 [Marinitoga sp. 4572_148]
MLKKKKEFVILTLLPVLVILITSCANVNQTILSIEQINNSSIHDFVKEVNVLKPSELISEVSIIKSSALVTDNLQTLYVDNNYIFTSGDIGGYSYFRWDTLDNIRGNLINVSIPIWDDFVPGSVEFAKNPINGNIYARYWNKIIDAFTGNVLFENAPDPTNRYYGCAPKNRFLIDDFGNFWVGASEIEDESLYQNGLYIIDPDFSNMRMVFPEAVWQIYMDSKKNIWVISKKGIYKFLKEDSGYSDPILIFDSESNNVWGEAIIEYGKDIVFLAKNFFDNPNIVEEKNFWLYKISNSNGYEVLLDKDYFISFFESLYPSFPEIINHIRSMNLFVFNNKLFIIRMGNDEVYEYTGNDLEKKILTKPFGQEDIKVIKRNGIEIIVSVGNIKGISFYNLNGKNKNYILNQVSTSNNLVSNYIHNIFLDEDNGILTLSHLANGYTVIDNEQMQMNFLKSDDAALNSLSIIGFFKHNGKLYTSANDYIFEIINSSKKAKKVGELRTNGEKIYYHNGRIWSFLNAGATDNGKIGYMNLETLEVYASDNEEYRNAKNMIPWEKNYQIYDIIGVDEDTVFIGVGSERTNNTFPYILQYKYSTNSIDQIPLPDNLSMGIFKFTKDIDGNIWGISNKKVFKFTNGKWEFFTEIELGNDIRDALVLNDYLIIISGWNSNYLKGENDGIEFVNLKTGESTFFKRKSIGLPTGLTCATVLEKEKIYQLWIGSHNGLAYIKIPKEIFDTDKN